MSEQKIILPSKPKAVVEENNKGVYEIDGLVPGYGFTLGNSLRRIILSSIPGVAITAVKIEGVQHEFSTLEGVKEDIITILLNLKNIRFAIVGDEPKIVTLSVKGPKVVTARDIKTTGDVSVINQDHYICEVTGKKGISMEITIEKGLGFVTREQLNKQKAEIGTIFMDAIFSPIRRASYDVEEMRVGDKTNFNRLRLTIETDGSITPRMALERSVRIMIDQLAAIIEVDSEEVITEVFKNKKSAHASVEEVTPETEAKEGPVDDIDVTDVLKTRIDSIGLSTRTLNALSAANIRTVGGIARKHKNDLLEIDGIGDKGIQEIRDALSVFGLAIKE
jgi:DNA-directed RNA polymerase subunit alpha